MKPILRKPPTFCNFCNSNTIDIFNQYNSAINYFDIIKNSCNKADIISQLNNRKYLAYMKCIRCGRVYIIDWEQDIPRPLYDERIENQIRSGTIFKSN